MATERFKHEVSLEDHLKNGVKADVLVCMGSQSDWESTMRHACVILDQLGVTFLVMILSAHRTPDRLHDAAGAAEMRGFKVVIAGAGGAAHLPGMFAAKTALPVIGVPVQSKAMSGLDSLLSIVQMPPSTPVATMAIGVSGAKNAGIMAGLILGVAGRDVRVRTMAYRGQLSEGVAEAPVDEPEKRI